MSLQYRKKQVRDEVDFLDADKHDRFLLVDLNTQFCNTFIQFLKKEVRNGVHLLHADKHQGLYKGIFQNRMTF